MFNRRLLFTAVSTLVLVAIGSVWGQRLDPRRRTLDPGTIAIRLLLGVGDRQVESWGGRVELDHGAVLGVEGWRFHPNDRFTTPTSWEARSRTTVKKAQAKKAQGKQAAGANTRKKAAAKAKAQAGADHKEESSRQQPTGPVVPNGVIVSVKAPDDAKLSVRTEHGEFTVALADLASGAAKPYLGGRVLAQRVPPSAVIADTPEQDDAPAAALDQRGALWVAYVVHVPRGPAVLGQLAERPKSFAEYVPKGGGDQVRLVRFADGQAGEPIAVTAEGLDVWRPAVAVAKDGAVVVVWSENKDGNFDLHERRYSPGNGTWSNPVRLTSDPGSDSDAVLKRAPDGTIWVAWQAWRDGRSTIALAPIDRMSAAETLSSRDANAWSPSMDIDREGRIVVAHDAYGPQGYDVLLRARSADGKLGEPIAVANSPLFEVRPSVALDGRGRAWVAYEERDAAWGKDFGEADKAGTALYRGSAVRVRCVDGNRVLVAPDPVANASEAEQGYNGFPRIRIGSEGRPWLALRHRLEARNNAVGVAWVEMVTSLSGKTWTPLQVVPRSDGMLDNRPALVAHDAGQLSIVYAGDGRLSRDADHVEASINVAALVPLSRGFDEPALEPVKASSEAAANVHDDEAADIARLRAHRIESGGKSYRLLRGEFHRHTEISGDGGNDGALEDMWRYAIDAAGLDWIGNGDHDNGGGKEYTWWVTQKTTDLYHSAARFTPMFTYERSVQYPHGHRNVMFDRRGIRTLPRLRPAEGPGVANGISLDDTKMLYDYLNELGGICASHTSGTTQMGTDWRDNNARAEPIVEIFQGIRNSYEALGEPRVGRSTAEAVAGMQPYGMIWNALALQYRFGFQSSSDHISTHISYAVAIAEDHTRAAILDAFRKRHCYAATDNILLDARSGDHLMGDEFTSAGPVTLKVLAHGTRPIARVDIIKDFVHVYTTEPKRARVEFTWTDAEKRGPGTSWYYVRVIQEDGELAWGTPMWVTLTGAAGGN